DLVAWIIPHIRVEIPLAGLEQYRVLRRPAPYPRVVVSSAEAHEAGVGVEEAACEALRNRPGLRRGPLIHAVEFEAGDVAPLVVTRVQPHVVGVGDVDDVEWRAQVIADDAIQAITRGSRA